MIFNNWDLVRFLKSLPRSKMSPTDVIEFFGNLREAVADQYILFQTLPPHFQVVTAVGLLVLVRILKLSVSWLYVHFLVSNDLSSYGGGTTSKGLPRAKGWALITGASEGIGLALAIEIAARGMNIILVSRSEKTLSALQKDLQARFSGISVEFVAADASDVDATVNKLAQAVDKKNLTLLVNNVGVEKGDPTPFETKRIADIHFMLDVNIRFGSVLTATLLPTILYNCKANRLRGGVINLSSNASILDTPLLVAYTSSKEYIRSFSNTLAGEMAVRHPGLVDVLCVRPSFVESRMSGLKASSLKGLLLGVATGPQFAKATLDKLGTVDDISPFWKHDVGAFVLTQLLPKWLNQRFMFTLTSKRYAENMKNGKYA